MKCLDTPLLVIESKPIIIYTVTIRSTLTAYMYRAPS